MQKKWATNAEAIVWVLLSTGIFSLIFASGKFAGDTASVVQINFLRMIGGFIALMAIVIFSGARLGSYRSSRSIAHFMRAVLGVGGAVLAVQAQTDMPTVDATAMGLLYVVFVLILGMAVFHERIGRKQWSGILLCCAGAVGIMVSRGAFQHFDPAYVLPASFAIGGAALFAVEGLLIKHLAVHDRPMVLLVHVNVFGMLMLAIPAWIWWEPLPLKDSLLYMALGPVGVFAQYCTIRGYGMADISIVGPVDYSWLIFAALIGWYFGEIPTWGVAAGAALIAVGGIVLATVKPAREKQPVLELQ
ncbi:DMT family transporter [Rhizobium sp. TH2]|uniref:DMT family transporter n=1 Tax=Rhizobium sp. TH2 TaxID=2775403 RepID=UPI002158213A|nr:DMT family transporter [Rhizobium sp. TH2]UVC07601.1 DMT family transporter [Rhizobium sp. TH2]